MYIGFDIGGSSLKSVLIKNQELIASRIDNLPANFPGLLNLIGEIVNSFITKTAGIKGIGVSVAGVLDLKREKILKSPNIRFLDNQPLKKLLQSRLKFPVKIEHDVHAFLWAEKKIGLAKNLKNVFYLTLGTGVGGAFMINGEIIKGSHGAAGEVGHIIMDLTNKLDFEVLAANQFIKDSLKINSEEAVERAKKGDKKARQNLVQLGNNLGVGIANIINIFDPEAVILAGGVSLARKFIEPGIKQAIHKFVISPDAKKTKILFSDLNYLGGALGAALLFLK